MILDFNMPVHLYVEVNAVANHREVFGSYGKRCMIVTGGSSARKSGALDDVVAALEANDVKWQLFDKVGQNPLLSVCHDGGQAAADLGADFIVGIGGGSPLDAAKAVAVFAANPTMKPIELYGSHPNGSLPFLLVGTTAGTGSEITRYSVLTVDDTGLKQSWGNQQSYARAAFGDPRYTMSVPMDFTMSTGLDAVSHALEAYFSKIDDCVSDLLATEALRILLPTLRDVWMKKGVPDLAQRETLYMGSIYAGYALNRCGTAACHLMGYYLSEQRGIPHGYACSVFLPEYIRYCVPLMPDKARRLFAAIGMYAGELCDTIDMLTSASWEPVDDATMQELLDRWDGSKNIQRTPGNLDRAQQLAMAGKVLQGIENKE